MTGVFGELFATLIIISPIVFIIAVVYALVLLNKKRKHEVVSKHSKLMVAILFLLALLPWLAMDIYYINEPERTRTDRINENWELGLSEPEAEELYADQGVTFNGDGKYYLIERYPKNQKISQIEWESGEETASIRKDAQQIVNKIQKENDLGDYGMIPENTEAYYKTREDHSELYLFYDRKAGLLYIIMLIC